jgi:Flp pilus assembly pilin Flp
MKNELRNRALHLIAAHMNTNHESVNYHSFKPESIGKMIAAHTLVDALKTAINHAIVSVEYAIGEMTSVNSVNMVAYFNKLKEELESILSEISTQHQNLMSL